MKKWNWSKWENQFKNSKLTQSGFGSWKIDLVRHRLVCLFGCFWLLFGPFSLNKRRDLFPRKFKKRCCDIFCSQYTSCDDIIELCEVTSQQRNDKLFYHFSVTVIQQCPIISTISCGLQSYVPTFKKKVNSNLETDNIQAKLSFVRLIQCSFASFRDTFRHCTPHFYSFGLLNIVYVQIISLFLILDNWTAVPVYSRNNLPINKTQLFFHSSVQKSCGKLTNLSNFLIVFVSSVCNSYRTENGNWIFSVQYH